METDSAKPKFQRRAEDRPDEVLDAARAYFDATGRRVSIEYALIKDMNDHGWRADLLAEKLNARGKGWVHVNPIPLNPTPGWPTKGTSAAGVRAFAQQLEDLGVNVTVRRNRGTDIDAACGQLAAGQPVKLTNRRGIV